jgi:hypothetical protein
MAYTYDTFIADYPEFADLPPAAVNRQLRQSVLMLHPGAWGKWYEMAQGLWTAHYLALEYNIAGKCAELGMRSPYDVGTVNNQAASTGSVSIGSTTSAMLTGDDPILADFARTTYGMKYLNLLYTVIPAGGIVYSPDTSYSVER